jgi:hypothetical protein
MLYSSNIEQIKWDNTEDALPFSSQFNGRMMVDADIVEVESINCGLLNCYFLSSVISDQP